MLYISGLGFLQMWLKSARQADRSIYLRSRPIRSVSTALPVPVPVLPIDATAHLKNSFSAQYSVGLVSQISDFASQGYVLIKRGDYSKELVESVNKEIIVHYNDHKSTWKYKIWRLFNQVSTAELRHSFPLPMTER